MCLQSVWRVVWPIPHLLPSLSHISGLRPQGLPTWLLGGAKRCQQPGYADPGQVARPVATVLELLKSSLGHEDLHPSPEGIGSWRRRKSPFWLQAGLEDGSSGTAQSEASVLTAGAACPVLTMAVQ